MFYDNDTKDLIEASECSEAVVIEYPSGNVSTFGIFDEVFMQVQPDTGARIMITKPRLTLYYNDILEEYGEITNHMYVTCRNKRFRVTEPQSDGTGLIHLVLKDA